MNNWGFGGYGRVPQGDANLANMSQAHLMALGQQGNASHEQLLEMQAAQQGMKQMAEKQNIEVVNTICSILEELCPEKPKDINAFKGLVDASLQKQNNYYKDLISDKVLRGLEITIVKKGGFRNYMCSIGKLGGQNKVPRLANDRKIADKLNVF